MPEETEKLRVKFAKTVSFAKDVKDEKQKKCSDSAAVGGADGKNKRRAMSHLPKPPCVANRE